MSSSSTGSSRLSRYKTNLRFWMGVDPNVDGMLQGYGHLSPIDATGSVDFLTSLISGAKAITKPVRALDCGAGIGRVSREVLLPLFEGVDLVDQNENFMASAPSFIGPELSDKVGQYFCSGLQDFDPSKFGPYSCIWVQWVIGYLTDNDLVAFFERCKKALTEDGVLIIKDNVKKGTQSDFDEDDGSLCRPEPLVTHLLKRAGFTIVKSVTQPRFPAELYPVRMLASIPAERRRKLENKNNVTSQ